MKAPVASGIWDFSWFSRARFFKVEQRNRESDDFAAVQLARSFFGSDEKSPGTPGLSKKRARPYKKLFKNENK